MITKELQLDGQHTDLTDTVAVTVKGPDIAEMRSGAAYSNTFKLPYTRKNSVATGNAGNLNVTPSGSGVPASLTIGGIDALSGSGQAFVRGSDRGGYSVDIKGGAYNFFDLLKNTQLVDLPGWAAHDFDYSSTDIFSRLDITDDIVFAMVDYGRQQSANYVVVDGSSNVIAYPSMRLQFLIGFMCNALGYEVAQEPTDQIWARLAIPFNKQVFQNGKRYIDSTSDDYSTGAVTLQSNPGGYAVAVGPTQYQYMLLGELRNVYLDTYFVNLALSLDAFSFTVNSGTMTVFALEIVLLAPGVVPGGGTPIQTFTVASAPGGTSLPARVQDSSLSNQFNASTGCDVYLQLRMVASVAANVDFTIPKLTSTGVLRPRAVINRNGYRFTPEALLPAMSCADLMRATLIQMGAFITVDEQAKQVSIMSADQVAGLEGFASDWGRKFADTLPVPTATDYRGFSATNWLRFTKDSDVAEQSGDGSFAVATGDGQSKTYLQTPFSPSRRASVLNLNIDLAQVLHWQKASDDTSWQEYSTDTVRLLILNTVALSKTYLSFSSTSTVANPVVGMFTDYYQNGLGEATLDYAANGVYQTVARWANEGRRFTAKFLLSLNDIQSMHLMQNVAGYELCGILRPVHVPQLGATCLIESISQWVDEETPCEVTLLKIG